MNGFLLAAIGVLGGLGLAVIGDMLSEEVRDRLDHLPRALLRLAAYRLDPAKRDAVYVDEWVPELTYILRGSETRPVSRLYHGTRFALGILAAARRIDRDLRREAPLPEGQPDSFQAVDGLPPLPSPRSAGPTVQRLVLGGHLRRLREEAGMTTERAGASIRGSHSKIARMEHGRVGFKERDIADLLTLYGVGPGAEREALLKLAREANTPGWWEGYSDILPHWVEPYFGLEAAADFIREYGLQFVPGLLQTEDYARAVMRLGNLLPEEEAGRRVGVRVSRQEILYRENPPKLWAVLDECALMRAVGGREVMKAQIRHLIDMCDHPAVTLQILPLAAGAHHSFGGQFTILRYAEPDLPDVVYIEQLTSALYLDKSTEVEAYLRVIEEVCLQAEPSEKTKAILKRHLSRM